MMPAAGTQACAGPLLAGRALAQRAAVLPPSVGALPTEVELLQCFVFELSQAFKNHFVRAEPRPLSVLPHLAAPCSCWLSLFGPWL